MERLDIIGVIVVIASCAFVLGLTVGMPAYSFYCRWREKKALRLRDEKDAKLTDRD